MYRFLAPLLLLAAPVTADPAEIVNVEARPGNGGWNISVTLRHGDTGWEDYADGWRVLAPDGSVLATRVLAHPHVNEQPFTRSLGGVRIPDGLEQVKIQSSTLTDGWSGETISIEVSR